MGITRIVSIAGMFAVIALGAAKAQSQQGGPGPRELPPVGYAASEYVDSAGCAFVRAGLDGNVLWVPRVGPDRKALCGFEPTRIEQAAASPAPVMPAPAAPDVTLEVEETAQAPVMPEVVAAVPPPPARTSVTKVRTPRSAPSQAAPKRAQQTRVIPAHVWRERQAARSVKVPRGYRPVWEDDRLNIHRGEQTLEGMAQSRLIWTETVPRRLIDRSTGRDVTTTVALVYPYTDTVTQQRNLGDVRLVERDGKTVKLVRPAAGTVVYSSRNAPVALPEQPSPARPTDGATRGHYVQIAVFAKESNAMTTARQVQGLGLPVRLKTSERQGKTILTLVAGPFARDADVQAALGAVRGAGFHDAFLR